jgi:hypothetical protein
MLLTRATKLLNLPIDTKSSIVYSKKNKIEEGDRNIWPGLALARGAVPVKSKSFDVASPSAVTSLGGLG